MFNVVSKLMPDSVKNFASNVISKSETLTKIVNVVKDEIKPNETSENKSSITVSSETSKTSTIAKDEKEIKDENIQKIKDILRIIAANGPDKFEKLKALGVENPEDENSISKRLAELKHNVSQSSNDLIIKSDTDTLPNNTIIKSNVDTKMDVPVNSLKNSINDINYNNINNAASLENNTNNISKTSEHDNELLNFTLKNLSDIICYGISAYFSNNYVVLMDKEEHEQYLATLNKDNINKV